MRETGQASWRQRRWHGAWPTLGVEGQSSHAPLLASLPSPPSLSHPLPRHVTQPITLRPCLHYAYPYATLHYSTLHRHTPYKVIKKLIALHTRLLTHFWLPNHPRHLLFCLRSPKMPHGKAHASSLAKLLSHCFILQLIHSLPISFLSHPNSTMPTPFLSLHHTIQERTTNP